MKYKAKNNELRDRAIINANEIMKIEEPPAMTTYLWCKVQTLAESILAEQREMDKEVKFKKDMMLYKSVMNQIGYDRGIKRLK